MKRTLEPSAPPDQPIDVVGRRGSPVELETDGTPCWLYQSQRRIGLTDATRHCPADLTERVWQRALRSYAQANGEYRWLRDLVDRPMAYSESRGGWVNEFERYVVLHHADIETVARELVAENPGLAKEIVTR